MFRRHLPACLGLLPLLLTGGAFAQEGAAADTAQRRDVLMLEEIIVTANRREQSLQEVPMSVSAFTGEFFEDAGVRGLADLEQYTPSLKITPGTDSRSTSVRIRGIGSVGTNVGIDPSVGLFIDGVYQGRAGMSVSDLLDIERVEILRGPQGTLYGKNTAAGAISIITRKPSVNLEGEAELTYNSDERVELRGMVNVPLGNSDHATRLTGFVINGDHLYENSLNGEDLNDANKWGFKSRTLFDGGDSLGEFLLTLDYTKEDTDCCAVSAISYNGLSTLNAPGTNSPTQELANELGNNAMGNPILEFNSFEQSSGFAPPEADPFGDDYWLDGDIFNKVDVGGIALEWNRDVLEDSTLTFINAWRHYESDSAYDGDFGGYNAVLGSTDVELDQYSSELRITSSGGETIDYQGGIYFYYSELDSVGTFVQSQELVTNMEIDIFFPEGTLNTDLNNYETTSYAAFGQVVWNISEQLSATLGLRYTYEKKERVGSQITTPESVLDIPPVAGPDIFYDESRDDADVSPSFNLRYFFSPSLMTYASVSRGFKSGGYNQRRELRDDSAEFGEEIATNYELGWKGSTEDRRLQFNGTFYFVDYNDFQSQTFDGTTLEVTNAGSMESYGSELELVFVPAANLTVSSALGYNKAEYKEFDNGQCTIEETVFNYYVRDGAQGGNPTFGGGCVKDLAGAAIDNAPEWTVSSFGQYDVQLGDNLVGVARLEHSYIDEFYLDQDLDENLKNDAVHLVNLRFTLTDTEGSWEAALWARNILDEEYFVFGIDIPVLGGYAGVAAPGDVYGITLRLRR
ncbi:MAG: TonB-dependent receptor [Halioglobus sp.]|nr:TonB-dependent receptor [Halioglobus sp.]